MNSTIAHTYLYNIIIVFLLIIFAFVMGMVVYYKSFKINKEILSIIEKYEGYNTLSKEEIENSLNTIGYNVKANGCSNKSGATIKYSGQNNMYCIYYYPADNKRYYTYGVTTYLTFDFPIVKDVLRIPIYTKSNRIFKFNDGNNVPRYVELEDE